MPWRAPLGRPRSWMLREMPVPPARSSRRSVRLKNPLWTISSPAPKDPQSRTPARPADRAPRAFFPPSIRERTWFPLCARGRRAFRGRGACPGSPRRSRSIPRLEDEQHVSRFAASLSRRDRFLLVATRFYICIYLLASCLKEEHFPSLYSNLCSVKILARRF